jgi:hypothetical protein
VGGAAAVTATLAGPGLTGSGRGTRRQGRHAPSQRAHQQAEPEDPLQVIMTAANTVSRASVSVPESLETIRVTISATSMTVTATARTSDPKGSPTRCATTSAWWTAASTAPARTSPTITSTAVAGSRPQVATSIATASSGTAVVQRRGRSGRLRSTGADSHRRGRGDADR